jgi:hypothetical protein
MTYTQQWRLAVALKQAYPLVRVETGAAEPPSPPTFIPVEKAGPEPWAMFTYGAAGGLVIGGLVAFMLK